MAFANRSFLFTDKVIAASPFVVASTIAGIKVFPNIINASLLVFTLSASSSGKVETSFFDIQAVISYPISNPLYIDIYCASRSLYGLAKDGQAPKLFAKTLRNGNPICAVAMAAAFVGLAFMNASSSSAKVFQYLVNLVTIFAVLNWVAISISHISFRRALKAQGIDIKSLPYVGILQPYGSYYSLFISCLVIVFNGKQNLFGKLDDFE